MALVLPFDYALLVLGTAQTGNATFQIFLVVFSIAARAVSVIVDSWATRKKWLLSEKWVFFLGRVFFFISLTQIQLYRKHYQKFQKDKVLCTSNSCVSGSFFFIESEKVASW